MNKQTLSSFLSTTTLSFDVKPILATMAKAGILISQELSHIGIRTFHQETRTQNTSQDSIKHIDLIAQQRIIDTVSPLSSIQSIGSEEEESLMIIHKDTGHYTLCFDPLDGSNNSEINMPMGTIFSLYPAFSSSLPQGKQQIIAAYILYGPSLIFTFTFGDGVYMFTYDTNQQQFVLTHSQITMPSQGNTYAINEAYEPIWTPHTRSFIHRMKTSPLCNTRWIGAMVADVHRILLQGGIFIYPETKKHPQGKLRLLYEINPFSWMIQQAGGKAYANGHDPLSLIPSTLHETSPIVLGSITNVTSYILPSL